MDTNEADVLLLIAYVVIMVFPIVLCWLYIKCVVLRRENQIYRRFFEQQYHLESDCMEACCEMVRECTGTDIAAPANAREPRQPAHRRRTYRDAKTTSVK